MSLLRAADRENCAPDDWFPGETAEGLVRLEFHDEEPPVDGPGWIDVLEAPYVSETGVLRLAEDLFNDADSLVLAGSGLYRIRIARRGTEDETVWRLRFWRVEGEREAARWLRRGEPAVVRVRWSDRPQYGYVNGHRPYERVADELLAIVDWSLEGTATVSVGEVAGRLLVTAEQVEGALAELTAHEVLGVETLSAGVRRLTRLPEAEATPEPIPALAPPPPAELPLGAPLRTGLITDEQRLLVWRDGEPVELARFANRPRLALETAHGILVAFYGFAVLVRPDGSVLELGDFDGPMVISADGRQLAATEFVEDPDHDHPWDTEDDDDPDLCCACGDGWDLLFLVDLADGRKLEPPGWHRFNLALLGLHDGRVYFDVGEYEETWRWRPGSDPELHPVRLTRIDAASGTALTDRWQEREVVRPGGTVVRIPADRDADLTPGGGALYTVSEQGPSVTVFDLDGGEPRLHWLPEETDPRSAPAAWEDPDHLLFPLRTGGLLRLDVRDGRVERVPTHGVPTEDCVIVSTTSS